MTRGSNVRTSKPKRCVAGPCCQCWYCREGNWDRNTLTSFSSFPLLPSSTHWLDPKARGQGNLLKVSEGGDVQEAGWTGVRENAWRDQGRDQYNHLSEKNLNNCLWWVSPIIPLISGNVPGGRHYQYPPFTDRKSEAEINQKTGSKLSQLWVLRWAPDSGSGQPYRLRRWPQEQLCVKIKYT